MAVLISVGRTKGDISERSPAMVMGLLVKRVGFGEGEWGWYFFPIFLYKEALSKPFVTQHSIMCQMRPCSYSPHPSYLRTLLPIPSVQW